MNNRQRAQLAWALFGLVAIATVWQIADATLRYDGRNSLLASLVNASYGLFPLAFSALGAFIITRQPGHTIGWLMIAPALSTLLDTFSARFVNGVSVPPAQPSPLFLIAVWSDRVSWVWSIFPLLFILLLFPTGRPPTRRWNGLGIALIVLQALFLFVLSFGQHLLPFDETWKVANPIGFIPDEWVATLYSMPLQVVLGVLTLLCAISPFVRYRQGSFVERTQIKWIAYVTAIFGVFYSITILTVTSTGLGWGSDDPIALVVQLPTALILIAIPVVIAIAILRHRLFDIDVIIRRTLVYAVLTVALGTVYLVSVVALQALFVWLTGQASTLAVVASTLAIAALFQPLRQRVQALIDRRFFRKKYDARLVLAQFAVRAQQDADLDALAADILTTVQEALEPEGAQLWLANQQEARR